MEKFIPIIFIYLGAMCVYGLVICLLDKSLARRHKWRISERHLILTSIFGGAVGVLIGMQLFRHKTRNPKFYITVPLFSVIWIGFMTLLIYMYFFK